jgi:hypothetical protein
MPQLNSALTRTRLMGEILHHSQTLSGVAVKIPGGGWLVLVPDCSTTDGLSTSQEPSTYGLSHASIKASKLGLSITI